MAILVDTCILGRPANRTDPFHVLAQSAVAELHRRGESLVITSQNLVEFRSFATRPLRSNGLGLDAATASAISDDFEATFAFAEETPEVYPAWRSIVRALQIVGKLVHDARLVAVCHVNSITHVLTFNIADFSRLAVHPPGIVVIDPAVV